MVDYLQGTAASRGGQAKGMGMSRFRFVNFVDDTLKSEALQGYEITNEDIVALDDGCYKLDASSIQITLVRAKLDILQEVVKELYHNDVIVENNETPLLGKDSEIQNEPLTVNENRRISNLYIQAKNKVATLSSDLKSCCNEIQHLRGVIDQKDKDIRRAEALAAAEIENHKNLRRIWEAHQDEHRHELLSRDRLAREEWVKNDVMIKELRAVSNKQRDEIMSLREKIEACETKWQESTAIASASVEAAETRSTNFATELRMLERLQKKTQVVCHLQRLVIKELLKEM